MSPAEIIIRGYLTAQPFARTWQIALRLGALSTTQTRQIMLRLERKGVVRRDERSAINDICWVLAERPARPAATSEPKGIS